MCAGLFSSPPTAPLDDDDDDDDGGVGTVGSNPLAGMTEADVESTADAF
jgi:hypothetical protein